MNFDEWLARNLAAMFLEGPWNETGIVQSLQRFCPPDTRSDQHDLVADLTRKFSCNRHPAPDEITSFLCRHDAFLRATKYFLDEPADVPIALGEPCFTAVLSDKGIAVPVLTTTKDVADWLGLSVRELDWLCDAYRQHGKTKNGKLQHYTYRLISKRSGSHRLIESPKAQLKSVQRKILYDILNHLTPHNAVHGFTRKRSCLTGAQVHAGEQIVITLDLKEFFPATRISRVHGLFRTLGYPHSVARCLTRLCTTMTPNDVLLETSVNRGQRREMREIYGVPHLPQGAPTSPALANLAAWPLDVRLTAFAARFDASYTRYADDLAFSGGQALDEVSRGFVAGVGEIVGEVGYTLNPTKIRRMGRGGPQRVTGILVNDHLNVDRHTFDVLKAILTNCCRHGVVSQNRNGHSNFREHLNGRVTWVENVNPQRGAKLRKIYEEIKWQAA